MYGSSARLSQCVCKSGEKVKRVRGVCGGPTTPHTQGEGEEGWMSSSAQVLVLCSTSSPSPSTGESKSTSKALRVSKT